MNDDREERNFGNPVDDEAAPQKKSLPDISQTNKVARKRKDRLAKPTMGQTIFVGNISLKTTKKSDDNEDNDDVDDDRTVHSVDLFAAIGEVVWTMWGVYWPHLCAVQGGRSGVQETVRKHFEDCGDIRNVRLIRDKKTCLGKGFGYVNFEVSCSHLFWVVVFCDVFLHSR
ncbi:hypothetical protein DPMN_086671 [Dreissena polymorpha]|uniref:RRM domain-containing protein n=1 Tax=Dreissena polymorpha TaxID=45954 RepID=A0A9D4KRL9_DREPO|nr:hypothetical protein DPMN_086671 [Dreissena polymorpha]